MEGLGVKIRPLVQSMDFLERVQNRREGDLASGNPQGQNPYSGENRKEPESEEVDRAIDAFHADAQAKSQGLTAKKEGQGPGLRIILADREGKIVRECSGSEFVRLKEVLSREGHASGKLLDQKA